MKREKGEWVQESPVICGILNELDSILRTQDRICVGLFSSGRKGRTYDMQLYACATVC